MHCFTFPVGPLSQQVEAALTKQPMSNTRREEDRSLGPMLPATRNILRKFHQPFNRKLASLLDNKAFLWNNSWRSTSTDKMWIDVNEQSEQTAKNRNVCYKKWMCMRSISDVWVLFEIFMCFWNIVSLRDKIIIKIIEFVFWFCKLWLWCTVTMITNTLIYTELSFLFF